MAIVLIVAIVLAVVYWTAESKTLTSRDGVVAVPEHRVVVYSTSLPGVSLCVLYEVE